MRLKMLLHPRFSSTLSRVEAVWKQLKAGGVLQDVWSRPPADSASD